MPSKANIADVLTRPYWCVPDTLPWVGYSMDISTHSPQVVPDVPVHQLPDVNKSEIDLMSQIVHKEENEFYYLMTYNNVRRSGQLRLTQKSDTLLMFERSLTSDASYGKIINAYARILQMWGNLPFTTCQDVIQTKIFTAFQQHAADYVSSFKGNDFYTDTDQNNLIVVRGRNTYLGATYIFISPT